jgi:putative transposase
MITDKLASYSAAKSELMPSVEHRRHKGLNNRAQNSHQVTRRRERQVKWCKPPSQAQRFLSGTRAINNLFHLRREHVTAVVYRDAQMRAFETWIEITGLVSFRCDCASKRQRDNTEIACYLRLEWAPVNCG